MLPILRSFATLRNIVSFELIAENCELTKFDEFLFLRRIHVKSLGRAPNFLALLIPHREIIHCAVGRN